VLLSGGSAGGIGTFKNLDYLQDRLPGATVKGAPNAGWFFPAALPSDLESVYAPSDWAHFSVGTHGNKFSVNSSFNEFLHRDLWQDTGLYPPACVADQKPDQYWACASVDKLYRYIKAPLYVAENQYDTNQIYAQEHAPRDPSSAAETQMVARYIAMYGEAMRNSTAQLIGNATLAKKPRPDGIFHPSCLQHGVSASLDGMSYLEIMTDWFFERNKLSQYYRIVEQCHNSTGGLPCNPSPNCQFAASGGCEAKLRSDGCLTDDMLEGDLEAANECEVCAKAHASDLKAAGCTVRQVAKLCTSQGVDW
jgi:hypothetical protein